MQAQLPRVRGAAPAPPAPPQPTTDVGAYHISPSVLLLAPGERACVGVTLCAPDTRTCHERLAIGVSDRSAPALSQ